MAILFSKCCALLAFPSATGMSEAACLLGVYISLSFIIKIWNESVLSLGLYAIFFSHLDFNMKQYCVCAQYRFRMASFSFTQTI